MASVSLLCDGVLSGTPHNEREMGDYILFNKFSTSNVWCVVRSHTVELQYICKLSAGGHCGRWVCSQSQHSGGADIKAGEE